MWMAEKLDWKGLKLKLKFLFIHSDAYFSPLAFTLVRKTFQNLLSKMLQSNDLDRLGARDKYLSREL
jgi:hypothetical protein